MAERKGTQEAAGSRAPSEEEIRAWVCSGAYEKLVEEHVRGSQMRRACELVRHMLAEGRENMTLDELRDWFGLAPTYPVRDLNAKILRPAQAALRNADPWRLGAFAFQNDGAGRRPAKAFWCTFVEEKTEEEALPRLEDRQVPPGWRFLFRADAKTLFDMFCALNLFYIQDRLFLLLASDGETLTGTTCWRGPASGEREGFHQQARAHIPCSGEAFPPLVVRHLYAKTVIWDWKHHHVDVYLRDDWKQLAFYTVDQETGAAPAEPGGLLACLPLSEIPPKYADRVDVFQPPGPLVGKLPLGPRVRKKLWFLQQLVQPFAFPWRVVSARTLAGKKDAVFLEAGNLWMSAGVAVFPVHLENDRDGLLATLHDRLVGEAAISEQPRAFCFYAGQQASFLDTRGNEYFCGMQTLARPRMYEDDFDRDQKPWRTVAVRLESLTLAAWDVLDHGTMENGFTLGVVRVTKREGRMYLTLSTREGEAEPFSCDVYCEPCDEETKACGVPEDWSACVPMEFFRAMFELPYDTVTVALGRYEKDIPFCVGGWQDGHGMTLIAYAKAWPLDAHVPPHPPARLTPIRPQLTPEEAASIEFEQASPSRRRRRKPDA